MWSSSSGKDPSGRCTRGGASTLDRFASNPSSPLDSGGAMKGAIDLCMCFLHIKFNRFPRVILIQTVAMKFILKHGKSDKDIHNLRQEIEVTAAMIIISIPYQHL